VDHVIFDTFGESIVSLSASATSPTACVQLAAEFDEVLHSLMILLHVKVLEFGFCFTKWIVVLKLGFKFFNEQVRSKPKWLVCVQECSVRNNLMQNLSGRTNIIDLSCIILKTDLDDLEVELHMEG